MKRASIVLLLVGMLSVSASAQILNTFTDVLYRARNDLNADTLNLTYLPIHEGNGRIREAMSLVNRLVGDNRTNTKVPLVINTYKYALPDSTLGGYSTITSVQWIRADSNKTLMLVPRSSWYEQEHQTTKGKVGMTAHPSRYDFYDDTIYINPTPSKVDTLYVTSVDRIVGLDTVTTLIVIQEDYRPAILKYVVYETAKARQHPLMAQYKQDYIQLWSMLFPSFRSQVSGAQ